MIKRTGMTLKLTFTEDGMKAMIRIKSNKKITSEDLADILHQYADLLLNYQNDLDS